VIGYHHFFAFLNELEVAAEMDFRLPYANAGMAHASLRTQVVTFYCGHYSYFFILLSRSRTKKIEGLPERLFKLHDPIFLLQRSSFDQAMVHA
jgi:hypothetical protein